MTMTFNEWLESTKELQLHSFGVDLPFEPDASGSYTDEEIEFVRWNVLAASDELHEALAEVGWKPWATSRHVKREQFVGEIVDVLHFVANLLCVVGVTGEELTERYQAKQKVNGHRQTNGYTGVDEKCPACGRALDDPGVTCTPTWCDHYGAVPKTAEVATVEPTT